MPALVIRLLSSIVDIIFAFLKKKISILAQSQNPWINYPPSSENWWPSANRISTTHKNFRSELTTKVSSPEAMPQATKSGWVASISKPNRIASWKPSFLDLFECYTQLANKLTRSNGPRNGEFTTSFIYLC